MAKSFRTSGLRFTFCFVYSSQEDHLNKSSKHPNSRSLKSKSLVSFRSREEKFAQLLRCVNNDTLHPSARFEQPCCQFLLTVQNTIVVNQTTM